MTAAPYPYSYGPPPTPPLTPPAADPGALLRLFAAILGVVAALLVIAGSFLPQTSFDQVVDGKTESSQTISAWSRTFTTEPTGEAKKFYDQTHVARYGIPLTAGAVVLLAGAGLALAGARRTAGPGLRSGARTALVAGGAGITAAVWMLGMDVSATLSYETDDGTVKSHYATGIGFWLLLGGGVVALVTLGLAVLAGRRAPAAVAPGGPPPGPYQQQARPPYPPQPGYPPAGYGAPGGVQPFGAQPPGSPASHPFPVQGPSSQPFPAQPAGGPASQPFPAQPAFPAPSGEVPAPGGVSSRLDDPFGGVTQAQPHPSQQEPASPTEPNYQLPPLHPPNT